MLPLYVRPLVKFHGNGDRDMKIIDGAATRTTISFSTTKSLEQRDLQARFVGLTSDTKLHDDTHRLLRLPTGRSTPLWTNAYHR